MPAGRPTIYTEDLILEICKRISEGESLKKICEREDMPHRSTVHEWILTKPEFTDKYESAVNVRTDNMFDMLVDIADVGEDVARDRLRIDARKWYLSKVMPKKYGDKMDVTSDGKAIQGNTIVFSDFKDDETVSE